MNLYVGVADRGRRGHDLGPTRLAVDLPGTEFVDGRFVEAHQRAQRPANQVQFVLNNKVGRAQGQCGWVVAGGRPLLVLGWESLSSISGERNP